MLKILYAAVILTCAILIEGKDYLRVVSGRDAPSDEFPYIVSLQQEVNITIENGKNFYRFMRICTASLITTTWVITAAHCFVTTKTRANKLRVRYGDMTIPEDEALKFYRKVRKLVAHPGYLRSSQSDPEDIALIQTEEVPVQPGRLSAIEYNTLIGSPVIYAGFGSTHFSELLLEDEMRPLQIGEGGIVPCDRDIIVANSALCVASKCNNPGQYVYYGDSGGPLLYKGHIIGVLVGIYPNFKEKRAMLTQYTPVSRYLEWINSVIHKP